MLLHGDENGAVGNLGYSAVLTPETFGMDKLGVD